MFGALLHEARLLNYLYGVYFLGGVRDQFVAPGKPTLPQEISLGVLGNCIVLEAIVLDYVKIFMCLLGDGLRSG